MDAHILEIQCLEALRKNRDYWSPRMPGQLFSHEANLIRQGILNAEYPDDIVQVLGAVEKIQPLRNAASLLAEMIDQPPMLEQSVVYRIEQLGRMARERKLKATLDEMFVKTSEGDWEKANQLLGEYSAMMNTPDSVGGFANSRCLDDPAPLDEEVESIIARVIYPKGMSILAGPGGLGKSWLAVHMGLCVASGDFWLGMQCRQPRAVGYLSLEMPGVVIRNRVKMLTGGKFKKDARQRFHYVTLEDLGRTVNILEHDFRTALAQWIRDKGLELLIVDPLKNAHRVDENDASLLSEVLAGFAQLGCAVLILHHVDKVRGQARGSSAIKDWCDAVMTLSQREDGLVLGWEKRPRFDAVGGDIPLEFVELDGKMNINRVDRIGDPWHEEEEA